MTVAGAGSHESRHPPISSLPGFEVFFPKRVGAACLFSLALVFSGYVATSSWKVTRGRHGAQWENFGLEVTVSREEQFLAWWHERDPLCVAQPYH